MTTIDILLRNQCALEVLKFPWAISIYRCRWNQLIWTFQILTLKSSLISSGASTDRFPYTLSKVPVARQRMFNKLPKQCILSRCAHSVEQFWNCWYSFNFSSEVQYRIAWKIKMCNVHYSKQPFSFPWFMQTCHPCSVVPVRIMFAVYCLNLRTCLISLIYISQNNLIN